MGNLSNKLKQTRVLLNFLKEIKYDEFLTSFIFFLTIFFYNFYSKFFFSDDPLFLPNFLKEGSISVKNYFSISLIFILLHLILSVYKFNIPSKSYPIFVKYFTVFFSVFNCYYFVFSFPFYIDDENTKYTLVLYWDYIVRVIGIVSSILMFKRPQLILVSFSSLIVLTQNIFVLSSFFPRSTTDYASIFEFGYLLGFFIVIDKNLNKFNFGHLINFKKYFNKNASEWKRIEIFSILLLGFHFSSYVISGIGKILGLHPQFSYLYKEPLYTYLRYIPVYRTWGIDLGLEPIKYLYEIIKEYNYLFTSFAVISEIIILFYLLRPRLIAFWAVCISLFHVVVFYIGGMFFYKWILLNLTIFFSFKKETRRIPKFLSIILVIIILSPIGFARLNINFPFKNYWLYWWDTFQYSKTEVFANTASGKSILIPRNIFLYGSLGLATYPAQSFTKTHEIGALFTASKSYEYVKKSKKSLIPVIDQIGFVKNKKIISNYLTNYFKQLQDTPFKISPLWFCIYPHHSYSSFIDTYRFINNNIIDETVSLTVKLTIASIGENFNLNDDNLIYTEDYTIELQKK